MRGRKPLPKAVLKLRDSSAKWKPRHRRSEPEPPAGVPTCPSWLDREGKAEWKRTTAALAAMGILKTPDRAVLAGLCQMWSLFVKTSAQLNKCRGIDKDSRPVAATNSDAYKNYCRACAEFGLTPSARTRIDTDIEGKKLDAFDAFVAKKKA